MYIMLALDTATSVTMQFLVTLTTERAKCVAREIKISFGILVEVMASVTVIT